jgi:hypothetical protein
MNLTRSVAFTLVPLAVVVACGGSSSSSGTVCSLDPACYEIEPNGECTLDTSAVCVAGAWQCSAHGTLGSGCLPDGGIAPPPQDAGTCPLDTLQPPLACNDDATCAPYGGHCIFDGLDGPGQCVCGLDAQDSGIGPDGCTGAGCYPVCTLPSFTISCTGPGDPSCSQYGSAFCTTAPAGGYVCACEALSDPPHGDGCPLDCTAICPPGTIGADCVVEPDGGYGCDCASGGLGGP